MMSSPKLNLPSDARALAARAYGIAADAYNAICSREGDWKINRVPTRLDMMGGRQSNRERVVRAAAWFAEMADGLNGGLNLIDKHPEWVE